MSHLPYKHYLELIETQPQTIKSKFFLLIAATAFILIGISSVVYWDWTEKAPLIAKYNYLQSAGNDFTSSSQSVNEVLSSFQVAGDKIEVVQDLKEASAPAAAAGFYVTLDDLERNLSKIESTANNVSEKKQQHELKLVPQQLIDLHNQILNFYTQTSSTLSAIYSDHLFAKQMLLATGPKFYLPSLTEDGLWERKNQEEIISYYQTSKDEANTALKKLSKLSPSPYFLDYYDAQVAYLAILVSLSDNIINTLSVQDDTNLEEATQIEKAYQLLVGAQRDNEKNTQTLLSQKLKLVDLGENLNKLAPIKLEENSIEQNLNLQLEKAPRQTTYASFFQNILTQFF